jgi:hypothetical protein
MNIDRFYKNESIVNADPINTVFLVDHVNFKRPYTISLETVGKILQLKLNEDLVKNINSKNVTALNFLNQDTESNIPPNIEQIAQPSFIAIDENYLYVWVPQLNKWKKILLTN